MPGEAQYEELHGKERQYSTAKSRRAKQMPKGNVIEVLALPPPARFIARNRAVKKQVAPADQPCLCHSLNKHDLIATRIRRTGYPIFT